MNGFYGTEGPIKAEVWQDDESITLTPIGADKRSAFKGKPRLLCMIEGETWEDVMEKYNTLRGLA